MGCCFSDSESNPIPPPPKLNSADQICICVAGYHTSPFTGAAHQLASHIVAEYPDKYVSWYFWDWFTAFWTRFASSYFTRATFPAHLKNFESSPVCWIETNDGSSSENLITFIGGWTELLEWTHKTFPENHKLLDIADGTFCCLKHTCHDGCSCCSIADDPFFQTTAALQSIDASSSNNNANAATASTSNNNKKEEEEVEQEKTLLENDTHQDANNYGSNKQ